MIKHRGPDPTDNLGDLYRVKYDDGDAEDLNSQEVKRPEISALMSNFAQIDCTIVIRSLIRIFCKPLRLFDLCLRQAA